jgi:hypothetical protein
MEVSSLKLRRAFAILVMISLVVVPVMGAMTEYQQGFEDGLKAGMRMGRLLGAAPYDSDQAQSYDSLVDVFNQGLASVFRDNQTAIAMFQLPPFETAYAGMTLRNFTGFKPIHAVDASFNQTRRVNVDIAPKYGGYDLDTWIALTGNVPDNIPTSSSLGGDAYDSMGRGP